MKTKCKKKQSAKRRQKKYVELAKWQAASNCKWSILQAVVVVVLLCLRLLPLIPFLFLSFSICCRESKGSSYRDNSAAHTLADTHMVSLTHTQMHTCRLCRYAAHTGITAQRSAAHTHWQTVPLTRMHTCTQVKPVLGVSQSLLLLLQFTVQRCSSTVKKYCKYCKNIRGMHLT